MDEIGRPAGLVGGDEHCCLRKPIGRGVSPISGRLKRREPLGEACDRRRITRSAPQLMNDTSPRSSPAISSSDVRAAASVKAKFGAAENTCGLRANNCIHRAGRCRKAIGLMITVGQPPRIPVHTSHINPMS